MFKSLVIGDKPLAFNQASLAIDSVAYAEKFLMEKHKKIDARPENCTQDLMTCSRVCNHETNGAAF